MDPKAVNALTVLIRKRQLELWRHIVAAFEVEDSLNTQVQTWIREDCVPERAYDRYRKRAQTAPIKTKRSAL
jgi:hypothetical protein